jgi:hypothetical protein
MTTRRAPRPVCDVDPLLAAAVAQLVSQHGRAAVLAAEQAIAKRELTPDATRDEKARLGAVIDRLGSDRTKFNPFMFVQRAMGARIPMGVCIEVLERVAAVQPENRWGFINTIMRDDYPHYRWGRS